MLICEDLLLLLVRDRTWEYPVVGNAAPALAAAVLIDLADNERLDVDEDGRPVLIDTSLTRHSVLDDAMRRLAEESGETIEDMLAAIATGLYVRMLDALTERGYLVKIGHRRWRLERPSHHENLCAGLRTVLFDGAGPDERTRTHMLLLSRMSVVDRLMDYDRRVTAERVEEIIAGDWATNRITRVLIEADDDWLLIGEEDDASGIVATLRGIGDEIADFFTNRRV